MTSEARASAAAAEWQAGRRWNASTPDGTVVVRDSTAWIRSDGMWNQTGPSSLLLTNVAHIVRGGGGRVLEQADAPPLPADWEQTGFPAGTVVLLPREPGLRPAVAVRQPDASPLQWHASIAALTEMRLLDADIAAKITLGTPGAPRALILRWGPEPVSNPAATAQRNRTTSEAQTSTATAPIRVSEVVPPQRPETVNPLRRRPADRPRRAPARAVTAEAPN